MNLKKSFISSISFCLIIMLGMPCVYASENQIYQESGQIHFDSTTKEKGASMTLNTTNNNDDYRKLNGLDVGDEFRDEVYKDLSEGKNVSVGYTTVYLKEVKTSSNEVYYEPYSVNEVLRAPRSSDVTKYSLTFNIKVSTYANRDIKYVSTASYIYWNPSIAITSGEGRVANGSDDYVSVAYPKPYVISIDRQTGGLSGTCVSKPYLNDIGSYGAVSCFRENNGGGYMRASSSAPVGSNKSRRFTAKYVHTWSSIVPSFNIGADSNGGYVNFTLSSSSSLWQIATYTDIVC